MQDLKSPLCGPRGSVFCQQQVTSVIINLIFNHLIINLKKVRSTENRIAQPCKTELTGAN